MAAAVGAKVIAVALLALPSSLLRADAAVEASSSAALAHAAPPTCGADDGDTVDEGGRCTDDEGSLPGEEGESIVLSLLQRRAAAARRGGTLEPGFVQTPRGPWREECVHELPQGAHWDWEHSSGEADGKQGPGILIRFADGTHRSLPPCRPQRQAVLETDANVSESADQLNWCETGGTAHSRPLSMRSSILTSTLQSFTADYYVPGEPKKSNGQILYWWIGVQPMDSSIVLQPVLSWGAAYNGEVPKGWALASWECCPGGHYLHSQAITGLQENDVVQAMIVADTNNVGAYWVQSCLHGSCSPYYARNVPAEVRPVVEFETWEVAWDCQGGNCRRVDCDLLPSSQLTISNLQISPPTVWDSESTSYCFDLQSSCGWTEYLSQDSLIAVPPG